MTLPGELTVERIIEHLKLDGYCIIPEVVPYDQVGAVRDSLEATALEQGRLHGLDREDRPATAAPPDCRGPPHLWLRTHLWPT